MIQLKGRIPSPIHIHGKIGKALPTFFTVTFKDGYNALQQVQVKQGGTAVYNGTVPPKDGNEFLGWGTYYRSNPIVNPDYVTVYQQISNVQEDTTCWAVYRDKTIIQDSWEVISQRSQAGTASEYYNVGDRKIIHIQGTVGVRSLSVGVSATILGFDHNIEFENSGITFSLGEDICFVDRGYSEKRYDTRLTDGTKTFNMNHWGAYTYGGWAGCDLRYDILGSTDVAPSGYGSTVDSSRVGYDATSTCATNPVANTLMSCLPSDLRAVMKPMIKYTDNTATTDYLPLMSEVEVFGSTSHSNGSKQEEYAYFNASNDKVKYQHIFSSSLANWWLRSPSGSNFCCVRSSRSPTSDYTYALPGYEYASTSLGISPVFLV